MTTIATNPAASPTVVQPGDMDGLIRSFPTLARRNAEWKGFDAWSAFAASGLSGGERDAACFILFVWNCLENQAGKHRHGKANLRFDLAHAMSYWDSGHLTAFARWAARPWFA